MGDKNQMDLMTIEEMRQHEWTISWSGGKDSTATIILCHKHKIPIRRIIYVRMMYDDNLAATLPIMTDFVDSAIATFERWGYQVDVIKSIKTAKDQTHRIYKRSKNKDRNGNQYGITAFCRGMCTFTDIKQRTIKSIVRDNEFEMIGYAADEHHRLSRLSQSKQSILASLGIIEREVFDICEQENLLSPLYKLGIKRDGCWFCPNAAKDAREYLRRNHPHLIREINQMIEMCQYDISSIVCRNNWLKEYYQILENGEQMNIFDFLKEDKQ